MIELQILDDNLFNLGIAMQGSLFYRPSQFQIETVFVWASIYGKYFLISHNLFFTNQSTGRLNETGSG